METLDVFRSSVLYTHEELATRLEEASAMASPPGQPRKGYEDVDTFLAAASKHLNAVDAVFLPEVRSQVPHGVRYVREYLAVARGLELALNHVKARAYGSVFQMGRPWSEVWAEVQEALDVQRRSEFMLAERIALVLDETEIVRLADRLHAAERAAPTRPHPYLPHTGVAGRVARRVVHTVDSFWDTVEGRMIPEPVRPPHAAPGPLTQYLLADPHFVDEDEDEGADERAGSEPLAARGA
ncbi:hypothetical protein [Nocardioides sp.]|uniref:hypothetical protein n=1 Tax=Nocardioides sp. TaxID=35761 RepID=UPI0035694D2E